MPSRKRHRNRSVPTPPGGPHAARAEVALQNYEHLLAGGKVPPITDLTVRTIITVFQSETGSRLEGACRKGVGAARRAVQEKFGLPERFHKDPLRACYSQEAKAFRRGLEIATRMLELPEELDG